MDQAHVPDRRLWKPSHPERTKCEEFRRWVCERRKVQLSNYEDLWKWSIENVAEFWEDVWEFTGVVSSQKHATVIDLSVRMDRIPSWFEGARLNWAENMLSVGKPESIAIIQTSEPAPGTPLTYTRLTYAELRSQVASIARSLRSYGIGPGDRVGYYGSNCSEAIVACLAATSLGAIWSSAAADFGPEGVLERFRQIEPKILFSVNAVRYNGKVHPHHSKIREVLSGLPTKPRLVLIDYVSTAETPSLDKGWISWADLADKGKGDDRIDYYQASFDHPLWILFSSGTTGKPKAIVHRAGGMLLQSKKENIIHGDMSAKDIFFYYTTPGWMMWNYLVAGLAVGCTLVLFDGSPLFDPSMLWKMAEDLKVTVFGTSAKYLDVLSKSYLPREHHDLSELRQILSTGSPLKPETFDFVYKDIKQDLLLGSITGGTDICSLFAGHNASLPVYRGELQCRNLGMSIEARDESGNAVQSNEPGDLVCTRPFPCMPIKFWGDDEVHSKYRKAYFDKFEGIWHHGDYCMITPSREGNGGGVVMLGRSDGVLNPGGVRFGSSEIYECVETFSAENAGVIEDCLAVGQSINGGADERVILFLKMNPGHQVDDVLKKGIKTVIRQRRSPRHVPEVILQVSDIPHTINGKRVEVPVKKLINGAPLDSINAATLRNPECLNQFLEIGTRLRSQ